MSIAAPQSRLLEVEERPAEELGAMAAAGVLFALIDACDAPEVPAMWQLLRERDQAVSLYSGDSEMRYATFAPYLFKVNAETLSWIRRALWDTPWGVFVLAPERRLEELRRHFRQFLLVQDPQGEEMYFRFYDPRVLADFLPTCSAGEIHTLFGPLNAYGIVADSKIDIGWRRLPGP